MSINFTFEKPSAAYNGIDVHTTVQPRIQADTTYILTATKPWPALDWECSSRPISC